MANGLPDKTWSDKFWMQLRLVGDVLHHNEDWFGNVQDEVDYILFVSGILALIFAFLKNLKQRIFFICQCWVSCNDFRLLISFSVVLFAIPISLFFLLAWLSVCHLSYSFRLLSAFDPRACLCVRFLQCRTLIYLVFYICSRHKRLAIVVFLSFSRILLPII